MNDRPTENGNGNCPFLESDVAQMMILGSLLIAVILVGLAVIVNSAIYTQYLSSQGTTHTGNAVASTDISFERTNVVLEETNRNHNNSYKHLAKNYSSSIHAWNNELGKSASANGIALRLYTNSLSNGTHIRDTNQSSDFTNASSGASNWTLVTDTTSVSDYRMQVNRDDLYTDDGIGLSELLSRSFSLRVTDESGVVWEVYIYENTENEVTVRPVVDGTEKTPCTAAGTTVEIDFEAETVGGDPCPSLSFAEGLSGPLDFEYRDSDQIGGTYEFRINRVIKPSTDDRYAEYGAGSPSATPHIYAATVTTVYTKSDLSIERQQQILAGDAIYTE